MPLTLEQYASYLDTRQLPWPPPPEVERPRARPHVTALPGLRAVLWNVYGTLLAVPGGDLLFEHPEPFVMNNALDRTVQEFKMWGSMSRKPGQPSEYLGQIYRQILLEQATRAGGKRHPEVDAARVWEAILKRLVQKDYKFDAGFYGSLNELARKVAYFFHASLQGSACYPGAAAALRDVAARGLLQGVVADGQCFTAVQLQRGLAAQDATARLVDLLTPGLSFWSFEARARTASEKLFRLALEALAPRGVRNSEVLYVTSRLPALTTAKRLGLRTALFAGDRASLEATAEQLREPAHRPDVLLTELGQLPDVLP